MWTSLVSLTIISGSYDQKSPIIIVPMHWLRSEGNRLHQSVCCGHFQLASYWWWPWECPSWVKTDPGRVQQLTGLIGLSIGPACVRPVIRWTAFIVIHRTKRQRLPAGDTLRIWQECPYCQCYLTYYWPTKVYRSEPSTTRYKYLSIRK